MIRFLLILCLSILPVAAMAQDDGTTLSRFLEDQLSDGDDRQVTISGFRGALSSEATLERMTISDADGVWLILEDAVLDWTRSALFSGELQIEALTAARLEIIRPPLPVEGADLDNPEAKPFSLPELPVRVEIGTIAVDEVVLGAPVIGLPATLSVEGNVLLADGAGNAEVTLQRLDGPTGEFTLNASYDNATRQLDLSLLLQEAENGLVAELLNLPDRPDLRLAVEGSGQIDDFTADIQLATSGEDRLTGQVVSSRGETGDQLVVVDIGGDITPLLLPDYRPFFGDNVQLQAQVRQTESGETSLEALRLTSAALTVQGDVRLNARGVPVSVSLLGQISPPNGDRVRLPIGGVDADIARGGLAVIYDRAEGDTYRLRLDLDALSVDELTIVDTSLDLQGSVAVTATGIDAATATIQGAMDGIFHTDPALAEALGTNVDLSAQMSWVNGAPMILSGLNLSSGDVALTGGVSARLEDQRLDLVLDLDAMAENLTRFAALAEQPLEGSVDLGVTGTAEALSGAFDLAITGTGRDLHVNDAVPDEIFAGETVLSAQVTRDATGVTLRDLSLENAELSLTGGADVSSQEVTATTRFQLRDVGLVTDVMSGPVTISADVARVEDAPFDVSATLAGPNAIRATVDGQFDAETADFSLALDGSADSLNLGDALPPQLFAGRTTVSAVAVREDGVLTVSDFAIAGPELQVTGDARIGPDQSRADISARLANVGIFTDALRGPVSATGSISRTGDGPWQLDTNINGPGGINADVNGLVGLANGAVDLTATGQAPLALANRYIAPRSIRGQLGFNLSLRGQPGLGALSGTLNVNGARVSVPTYGFAVENVGVSGQVSNGRLSLNGNGTLSTGGQLTARGTINLGSAGLDANLDIALRDARIVDLSLYEARISRADLTVSGPLARGPQIAGSVTLAETESRVPEASLFNSAAIPDIRFVGETRPERLTRQFAGMLGGGSSGDSVSGSNSTGIDITINAPGRIFLRGRGIDAEFGGTLRLFGTTANLIPMGQFELIRGRISILGTRLDFTEGTATLQGSFDPFLNLAATSRANGYLVTIRVVGPASSPEVTFSSSPSLPEDEVLAQLLFGRSVSGLSPLQLLQLADAATSLAGGSTNSGFIAGLRDGLGLDDLDLGVDEDGNAAVTAGRYLSDNIYSDVTINAEGDADLSLNIDLTPNITARGSVGSDGNSSIGIFFEQDY
ncbi:translocation/assembly module TamB domain-containing protein [Gymnodinialimonas ceratoperidinii]|uniref:Translocation/assembly module TamB domain-containing protein n=1 Tax=Gymnodinialimonas ceratoperidinii TaxID=2856823 RepID=A0A8F6TW58_9RHOB|nr:translocation/assembly module TamB domain-containing protein [Gymnodinialimonas ceratoperidinii]QXT40047.1 translocation/assembly module TamB domain-containing protein [Gymnodinialimonas ceratoperidinii]